MGGGSGGGGAVEKRLLCIDKSPEPELLNCYLCDAFQDTHSVIQKTAVMHR